MLEPLPPTNITVPGILVARVTLNEARASFQGRLEDLVLGVEQAYWTLYFSYWELFNRENAIKQALHTWQVAKGRYDRGDFRIQDLEQIEQQYQNYRLLRLQALGNGSGSPGVLEAERQLRFRMGLPPEDGTRLVPIDKPAANVPEPDWCSALQTLVLK